MKYNYASFKTFLERSVLIDNFMWTISDNESEEMRFQIKYICVAGARDDPIV